MIPFTRSKGNCSITHAIYSSSNLQASLGDIPKSLWLGYYRLMISKEEVLKLAELARLKVEEAEVETLQKDISSILGYVGQVSSVERDSLDQGSTLDQGPSRSNLSGPRNMMREDVPYQEGAVLLGKREALLKAFPTREGDYNVVRKIIQKDE